MRPADVLTALLVTFLWGMNFAIAKAGVLQIPPLLFVCLRFVLVAALLLPLVRIPRGRLREIAGLSVTLGFLHFALMFNGLRHVDAAVAAITIQVQVPFSALLAAVLYGETLGWRRAFGMVVAIAGVAVLAGSPQTASAPWAVGLVVAAALVWAVSNTQMKRLANVNGFAVNGWLGLFAAPQLALGSLLFEHGQATAVEAADWQAWAAIVYQAVVVVAVCYGLWYRLLGRYGFNQVIPFTLLVPLWGVLSGVLMLGEPVTWPLILGGATTLAGVAVIVFRRADAPAPGAS
jgi:O-acetylserine/cysteine efflux transporter